MEGQIDCNYRDDNLECRISNLPVNCQENNVMSVKQYVKEKQHIFYKGELKKDRKSGKFNKFDPDDKLHCEKFYVCDAVKETKRGPDANAKSQGNSEKVLYDFNESLPVDGLEKIIKDLTLYFADCARKNNIVQYARLHHYIETKHTELVPFSNIYVYDDAPEMIRNYKKLEGINAYHVSQKNYILMCSVVSDKKTMAFISSDSYLDEFNIPTSFKYIENDSDKKTHYDKALSEITVTIQPLQKLIQELENSIRTEKNEEDRKKIDKRYQTSVESLREKKEQLEQLQQQGLNEYKKNLLSKKNIFEELKLITDVEQTKFVCFDWGGTLEIVNGVVASNMGSGQTHEESRIFGGKQTSELLKKLKGGYKCKLVITTNDVATPYINYLKRKDKYGLEFDMDANQYKCQYTILFTLMHFCNDTGHLKSNLDKIFEMHINVAKNFFFKNIQKEDIAVDSIDKLMCLNYIRNPINKYQSVDDKFMLITLIHALYLKTITKNEEEYKCVELRGKEHEEKKDLLEMLPAKIRPMMNTRDCQIICRDDKIMSMFKKCIEQIKIPDSDCYFIDDKYEYNAATDTYVKKSEKKSYEKYMKYKQKYMNLKNKN